MRKYIFIILLSFLFISCDSSSDNPSANCGTKVVSGQTYQLYKGPQGGCYYNNSNGNKSYVDRSECNC